MLGVWHKGADGTDVNTTDRSPSHECLATGDDRGLVSLFRYPALGGRGKVYGGHSSHVTAVRTLTLPRAGEPFPLPGAGWARQGVRRPLEPRHRGANPNPNPNPAVHLNRHCPQWPRRFASPRTANSCSAAAAAMRACCTGPSAAPRVRPLSPLRARPGFLPPSCQLPQAASDF